MDGISHQDILVYVMVSISAVDREMDENEMLRIGNIVKTLPIFSSYNSDQMVNAAKTCRDILLEDEVCRAICKKPLMLWQQKSQRQI